MESELLESELLEALDELSLEVLALELFASSARPRAISRTWTRPRPRALVRVAVSIADTWPRSQHQGGAQQVRRMHQPRRVRLARGASLDSLRAPSSRALLVAAASGGVRRIGWRAHAAGERVAVGEESVSQNDVPLL